MLKLITLILMFGLNSISYAQTSNSNFQREQYSFIITLSTGIRTFELPETPPAPGQQMQQQCQQGTGGCPLMYILCDHLRVDEQRQQQQQCQQHQDGTPCSFDALIELKYNETIEINHVLYACLETPPQQQIQQGQQPNP